MRPTSAAKSRAKPGKRSPAKRPKTPRTQRPTLRCGDCHTCRHKHLKKACLRKDELLRQLDTAELAGLAADRTSPAHGVAASQDPSHQQQQQQQVGIGVSPSPIRTKRCLGR